MIMIIIETIEVMSHNEIEFGAFQDRQAYAQM